MLGTQEFIQIGWKFLKLSTVIKNSIIGGIKMSSIRTNKDLEKVIKIDHIINKEFA